MLQEVGEPDVCGASVDLEHASVDRGTEGAFEAPRRLAELRGEAGNRAAHGTYAGHGGMREHGQESDLTEVIEGANLLVGPERRADLAVFHA